jgi:hypothetical protein
MIGLSSSQLAVSQFCLAMKSLLLKNLLGGHSPPLLINSQKNSRESIKFLMLWVLLTDHIFLSWRPAFMQPTTIIARDFIQCSYRGLSLRSVFFWDFDIGWVGSMHDANLWAQSDIGQFCKAERLSPYALVGDAAYPCRP